MNAVRTVRLNPATRLASWLLARWLRYRLNQAEQDLEGFRRELVNREKQMAVHRAWCEATRVRIATLEN